MGKPFEALSSLHALLDVVEDIALNAKADEGGDALQRFIYELYKPDETEVRKAIETADTDTDFDAFASLGLR